MLKTKLFKPKTEQIARLAEEYQAEIDNLKKIFNEKLDKFVKTADRLDSACNKSSQSVRQSTQKMAEGLARIEKQANFDRLEMYVLLLERANVALSELAELESKGMLEKISSALK